MMNNNNEFVIHIPARLLPLVERLGGIVSFFAEGWAKCGRAWGTVQATAAEWLHLPSRSSFVPIVAIVMVFWPLLLSLIMAFCTAWTWILWLFTAVCLGLLQLGYVTYQFVMITFNVAGLSILKSYNTICLSLLSFFGLSLRHQSRSLRRQWRERLDNAGTYENFLKLRIQPAEIESSSRATMLATAGDDVAVAAAASDDDDDSDSDIDMNATKSRRAKHARQQADPALPPLIRRNLSLAFSEEDSAPLTITSSSSSSDLKTILRNQNGSSATPPRMGSFRRNNGAFHSLSLPRSQSFSGQFNGAHGTPRRQALLRETPLHPICVKELGEKTTDLLVTTTARLREARQTTEQAYGNGGKALETALSSLKFLLAGVVKRNHLTLDDLLLENARSVATSGTYGMSRVSRNLMRNYIEEVEKGLDSIVDAPLPQQPATTSSQKQQQQKSSQPSSVPQFAPSQSATTVAASNKSSLPPRPDAGSLDSPAATNKDLEKVVDQRRRQQNEVADRIMLVRKMKQNTGRTALMLSGGGAQAMYHAGIIRALIEANVYKDIRVVSGTSGGSIIAAMCAMKTDAELFEKVCVPWVSTDYKLDGEQKRRNIRWFPTVAEMASYWFKERYLVDSADFRSCCEFYYGDCTFEEAFERTGKHACITVSASRASGAVTGQRLLLNHISTPHVTIASAVAASCALPGVMAPAKLMAKNSCGTLEPFEVDGVEWIDGSVQADLPFQRISTLFAVSSFIVSQTNFHIVPLLNKAHHPNSKSLYWRLFQTMEWDIRSRALKLSRLGLFPKMFGQDISKVFKQRYHGNLTITPRFTTMQTFGLKALSNPTYQDMDHYLKYGQIAIWPYLNVIREMLRLEKALDSSLTRLEEHNRVFHPESSDCGGCDDLDSICSGGGGGSSGHPRVRITNRPPTGFAVLRDPSSDRTRQRLTMLESENKMLKQQLGQLEKLLVQNGIVSNVVDHEKIKNNACDNEGSNGLKHNGGANLKNKGTKKEQYAAAAARASVSEGSEGGVWNLVLASKNLFGTKT